MKEDRVDRWLGFFVLCSPGEHFNNISVWVTRTLMYACTHTHTQKYTCWLPLMHQGSKHWAKFFSHNLLPAAHQPTADVSFQGLNMHICSPWWRVKTLFSLSGSAATYLFAHSLISTAFYCCIIKGRIMHLHSRVRRRGIVKVPACNVTNLAEGFYSQRRLEWHKYDVVK